MVMQGLNKRGTKWDMAPRDIERTNKMTQMLELSEEDWNKYIKCVDTVNDIYKEEILEEI